MPNGYLIDPVRLRTRIKRDMRATPATNWPVIRPFADRVLGHVNDLEAETRDADVRWVRVSRTMLDAMAIDGLVTAYPVVARVKDHGNGEVELVFTRYDPPNDMIP